MDDVKKAKENWTRFAVAEGDAGQRLDRYLRKVLPSIPLSHVFQLIRKGKVKVNGKRVKGEFRLVGGEEVLLTVQPEELATTPEGALGGPGLRGRVEILFQDEQILVLDKPAGMAVHPGTGTPEGTTLIERVQRELGASNSVFQPALAHRLDRGTSGVVLVAKTRPALLNIQEQIRSRETIKEYIALVDGVPAEKKGVIKERLERLDSRSGGAKSVVSQSEDSVEAETHWKTSRVFQGYALLEVRIVTGRLHQIRAHLASIGHPIAGDDRYGGSKMKGLKRPFLHASRMGLKLWGRSVAFDSPLPEELTTVLASLPKKEK